MHNRQLIWLGLVAAGVITSTSAVAGTNDTNHSDASAGQTYSAPSVHIDSINGNGISGKTLYYPAKGEIVGGEIVTPIRFGDFSGGASGTGFGRNLESFFDNASGNSSGTGVGNQPREVTLNDVAEALNNGLEQSLDNLAAVENKAKLADSEPRRIARRSGDDAGETRACVNPVYEAREIVERQLIETEKFIEQVNEIEPQKSTW